MKRMSAILGIAFLIAAAGLLVMYVAPIKANKADPPLCCDQLILEASYGLPLPFKQVYSGGFTGAGKTTTNFGNMALDGIIIFAASATVLSVGSLNRDRTAKNPHNV